MVKRAEQLCFHFWGLRIHFWCSGLMLDEPSSTDPNTTGLWMVPSNPSESVGTQSPTNGWGSPWPRQDRVFLFASQLVSRMCLLLLGWSSFEGKFFTINKHYMFHHQPSSTRLINHHEASWRNATLAAFHTTSLFWNAMFLDGVSIFLQCVAEPVPKWLIDRFRRCSSSFQRCHVLITDHFWGRGDTQPLFVDSFSQLRWQVQLDLDPDLIM